MPEFILEGRDHAPQTESEFVLGYIEAMFFTESANGEFMADWFSDETQEALRQGALDGQLPADAGYTELHESALESIRDDCARFQLKAAELLELAFNAHWQKAAIAEGWSRNRHNGYFVGPIGHKTRMADYESWQELCECEGIEPGESYDATQAGRDFWFTRNGHGVGYWERKELESVLPEWVYRPRIGERTPEQEQAIAIAKWDSLGERLSAIARAFGDSHVWFGDHVDNGNAPFVYHE